MSLLQSSLRAQKRGLSWFLLVAALVACSSEGHVRVVLHNAAEVDLGVDLDRRSLGSEVEVLPGESGEFLLQSPLWIHFGMEAHEYEPGPLFELGLARVRLQARSDGRLYWVEPGATVSSEAPGDQPPGFPLSPVRIVDLT